MLLIMLGILLLIPSIVTFLIGVPDEFDLMIKILSDLKKQFYGIGQDIFNNGILAVSILKIAAPLAGLILIFIGLYFSRCESSLGA